MTLHAVDIAIVAVYLAVIITIGFIVKRKSAAGIESYFLGNRQLPWWMLAMSGSSSYFDITGTMWIVSLFVMLGLRGMWIQFLWGFVIAAFNMAYMGKWIRRSGVLTGAEWMVKRFGDGRQGDLARLSYTIYAIVTITAFLAYTAVGMGKFGAAFLPLNEHVCATLIIGITGLYVVVGGFRGLTIVEFFQTIILTCGAVMIAYLGWAALGKTPLGAWPSTDWFSLWPHWKLTVQPSPSNVTMDPMYFMFGAIVITYVAKGLLLCASGPEQLYDFQKFLAVKNPREASLTGMLWGVFHTVRFPMAAGIAVMGLTVLANDPKVFEKISTSADSERVLPSVIAYSLPIGLRGLALAALISAFMGTFSAMVNGGASYLVRDVYQRYMRPKASDRELVYASYGASVLFIILGIVISLAGESINKIFTWIMAALGAGVLLPNVLRWYWGRFNGWGYFAGTATGMVLSLVQAVLENYKVIQQPIYVTFPVVAIAVVVVAMFVALLTEPVEDETLKRFYRDVQPAGAWGRVAELVRAEDPAFRKESFGIDLFNVIVAVPWLALLYTAPVLLVTHQYKAAGIAGAIWAALSVILLFTWWPNLPKRESPVAGEQLSVAGRT